MRVAQEINYLAALTGVSCRDFKHVLINQTRFVQYPSIGTLTLFDYVVPASYGLLITYIYARSSNVNPTSNEATKRSEDIDYPFATSVQLLVNGVALNAANDVDSHTFINHDMLLPLNSNDQLLIEGTAAGAIVDDAIISITLHGYFVPSNLLERLVQNRTLFIGFRDVF